MRKYIDADIIRNHFKADLSRRPKSFLDDMLMACVNRVIDEAPAADVAEVRHGRWIHKDPSGTSCSKCGSLFPMFLGLYDYCPNCGALMDEVEV